MMRRGTLLSILQGRRQLPRAVSIKLTEMCNNCKFIGHYWNKDAFVSRFQKCRLALVFGHCLPGMFTRLRTLFNC